MNGTKYGKYILKEPLERYRWAPSIHVCGNEECVGALFPQFPVDLALMYIKEPFIMESKPHVHDIDELLFIFGGNPANFFEFDAEIEFYMGEEGEKNIIDTTAIVYIPKGLTHCPLNIKRVGKPFLFGHIILSQKYSKTVEGVKDFPEHKQLHQRYSPAEVQHMRKSI